MLHLRIRGCCIWARLWLAWLVRLLCGIPRDRRC